MSSNEILKKVAPLDIVIFHVGGVGGYGPVRRVIDAFPGRVVVVCFEANPSAKDLLIQENYAKKGVRGVFVPKCIGASSGKQRFYINKHRESSSIYPVAPAMAGEHIVYPGIATWGENCEVDRVVELDTVTLDELAVSGEVPEADILSMDTQGSEMPIMRGGSRVMQGALCVVSEVDFAELYEGQETFSAQHQFLTEQGYRLADIMNTQYWHPGPATGQGFLTIGEAIYLRRPHSTEGKATLPSLAKLIKLAAIAFAFNRKSHSAQILTRALELYGVEAEHLLASEPSFAPMYAHQRYVQANLPHYEEDNRFFYRGQWKEDLLRNIKQLRSSAGATWGRVRRALRVS